MRELIKVTCGHPDKPNGGGGMCKNCYDKRYYGRYYERKRKYSKLHNREYHLRDYNISPQQYEEMLKQQNNCCAICLRHKECFKRNFSIDHCHLTGKVRGLLCISCNAAIGSLNDDPSIIKRALTYLEQYA